MPGSHLGLPELFSVHYLGCGSHFSEHDLAFAAKLTKVAISDFFRSHFIFLSTSISHIPLPPLLQCTALSVNVWRTIVQKNVILTKIRSVLLYFLSLFLIFSFQWSTLWNFFQIVALSCGNGAKREKDFDQNQILV